jgi:hypothetical protein
MKLFALALIFASFNSFAVTSIKKTFDGGEARCLEMNEVGSRAYNLEAINDVVIGDSRIVTLKVNFYKCAEVPSGYGFRPSTASEVLSSFILLPNGKIGMTKNTLVKTTFFASNTDGKNLSISDLSKNSTITFTVNKSEKKFFVDAALESNISSELGNLDGIVQHYGGFVIQL